jgi:hypothetical protein
VTRHREIGNEGISSVHPSPGAIRMRRARWRKSQGALFVNFLVGADAIANLVALGWLDPEERGDRDTVTDVVIGLAMRALALRGAPRARRSRRRMSSLIRAGEISLASQSARISQLLEQNLNFRGEFLNHALFLVVV